MRIDDTTTDARWPRWNEAVSALGVRSVLSAPLLAADESIGAMKVYCERPRTTGRTTSTSCACSPAQAAILLANSQSLREARRLSRQLTDALASRDAIAQATGVLLAQGAAEPAGGLRRRSPPPPGDRPPGRGRGPRPARRGDARNARAVRPA